MSNFKEKEPLSPEIDPEKKLPYDWRDKVSYPKYVSRWAQEMLDQIVQLIPEPKTPDRFSWTTDLLESARKEGIITEEEHDDIRRILAREM